MSEVILEPWRFVGLLGFDMERVVGREVVDSCCLSCLDGWRRIGLCVVGGAVGRHCGCELGKFRLAIRARRRRPGLEMPGDGAELAPLEVR